MTKDVVFKVSLKDGYLLRVLGDGNYQIHHENGNGYITFRDKHSLLEYVIQIGGNIDITDTNGEILEVLK